MKYLPIYFFLFAILLGLVCAASVHDAACNQIQKQGVASCFNRSTLGFCMKIADEWRAIEAATCDSRLCCNARLMGCTMDADCKDELTTSSVTRSTTELPPTTTTPAVTCVVGNLRKHETDCKRFYYCSRNVWVESVCSAGGFDENRMSCAFGACTNN